jgi:mono/diheme cytochrome c family protein
MGDAMRKWIKWLGIVLGSVLGLAILAMLTAWIGGGLIADRRYAIPPSRFAANNETADIAEGRRIALTLGCFDGCHGEGLGGSVFYDDLLIGTFIAPDLTRTFADLGDEELDSVIRHGVRRNGKSTFIMPSSGLHHLSDEDLNDITVFIRSQPVGEGPAYAAKPGLIARFFLLIGEFNPQAQDILDQAPWMTGSPTRTSPDAGRYLAQTACAECHGMDFRGEEGFTPPLAAVAAYSLEDFHVLMKTGVANGNRELDLMKEVATGRFVHFTDSEVEALHGYLQSLAAPR